MPSALFSDTRFRLDFTISVVRQEAANNRTLVRRRLTIVKVGSSYAWSGGGNSWSITGFPGNTSGSFTYDFDNVGSLLLYDANGWVNHGSNGTAFFNASASVSTSGIGSASIPSFRVDLPTIARATTPTVAGGFTTGLQATIMLPRADAGYTHDVSWKIGSKQGSIQAGAGTSTVWTPPHEMMTELPDAATGHVTLTVVTKNGATTVGTTNTQIPLEAGPAVVPAVTGAFWTDANPTVAANIGAFVQGLSRASGTVTAAGVHGSTIVSKRLVIAGQPFSEGTPFLVTGAGTVPVIAQATDSRGRDGEADASFQVLPYQQPRIGANGWQVRRANSSNVPADDGTYLRIDLHATASSLIVGGEQKNGLKIVVVTRPVDGAPTTRNTIYPGLTQNGAIQVTGGGVFTASQSYEVTITITDNTSAPPVVLRTVVGTTVVTIDLHGDKVGIGKMHEFGALDVDGPIFSSGEEVATQSYAASMSLSLMNLERPYATQGMVDSGANDRSVVSPKTLRDRAYAPWAEAAGIATVAASGITTVMLPPGRFTQTPIITAVVVGHANVSVPHLAITNTDEFSARIFTIGAAQVGGTLHWRAVQMTSASASG